MNINLSNAIQNEGNKVDFQQEFKIDKSLVPYADLVDDVVLVKGDLTFLSGEVKVNAIFSYGLSGICDRCLKPVEVKIDCRINEKFVENADGESYTFSGNNLDLAQALNDSIMLSVPSSLLCSEDCKGLCFKCGQNLNEKECGCDRTFETVKENPFAVLLDGEKD